MPQLMSPKESQHYCVDVKRRKQKSTCCMTFVELEGSAHFLRAYLSAMQRWHKAKKVHSVHSASFQVHSSMEILLLSFVMHLPTLFSAIPTHPRREVYSLWTTTFSLVRPSTSV